MTHVRPATASDLTAIEAVHRAAFPTDLEARLVALLFTREKAVVSLVAEESGSGVKQIVGHILFSPVAIEGQASGLAGLGLAPLAVLPAFQRRGIGSALVRAGVESCRARITPFIVVLGEPTYYNRFGFQPASRWRVNGEYRGGDAFQLLPLERCIMDRGHDLPWLMIRYADEFREIIGR